MSGSFEILSHTADYRLRVRGDSLSDLFRGALRGAFKGVGPKWKKGGQARHKVSASGVDRNDLLVNFLSEALGLSDIHNEAYTDIKIEKLNDFEIYGELVGRPVGGFNIEIKAVTHHGLKIKEAGDGLEAEIVFDI